MEIKMMMDGIKKNILKQLMESCLELPEKDLAYIPRTQAFNLVGETKSRIISKIEDVYQHCIQ